MNKKYTKCTNKKKTLKNLKYNNKVQEKNRTLQIVEKANLQNDKIPSKVIMKLYHQKHIHK